MKLQVSLQESLRRRTARAARRATRGAFGFWAWSNTGTDGRRDARRKANAGRGRRGSTLLVVMALLGMLLLLGMLYFTFASQEQQNARNFAREEPATDVDPIEDIFNESIRQLILGANYPQKNSVLWGGRHSMLGTLNGQRTSSGQWKRQPYTGQGVSLSSFVTPNDSPAANDLQERNLAALPGSDVDRTYPDFTNMFLAYHGTTWDTTTNPPTRFPIPVVKPAFHRPELLRDFSATPPTPLTNWTTATATAPQGSTKGLLFRPHPEHLYVWRRNTTATPERRFIIDSGSNPTGDTTLAGFVAADAGLIGAGAGQVTAAFPFLKDQDSDGNFNEQGVWSRAAGVPNNQMDAYDYDVDTDGDGIADAIWIDLDLPMFTRATDNRNYIPLIAFKVLDLDGLLNLNAVGNLSGDAPTRSTATTNFGNINNANDPDISRSGMALTPYEINPIWALDSLPGVDFTLPSVPNDYYVRYFGHDPVNPSAAHRARETGNMEWWWLNKGRVDYLAPNQIHSGRLGEASRLWSVLSAGPNAISANSNLFPFSGVWDQDDNLNVLEGGPLVSAGLPTGQSFIHPLALNGYGRFWAANPKQLDLLAAVGGNPSRWLRYSNMGVGDDGSGTGNVQWLTTFGGALMVNPIYGATFATPGSPPNLVDDMTELVLEPKVDTRPHDEIFEPRDTLLLFMNQADRASTGVSSRVRDLMPGNIDIAASGGSSYLAEIGKRFTTTSWDLKQFALNSSLGPDGQPNTSDDGEWNVDSDGNSKLEWPPQFNPPANYQPAQAEHAYGYLHNGSNSIKQDPFRPQLRQLLKTEFGRSSSDKLPMRLSINDFLDVEHTPGAALPKPYDAQNSTAYVDYFRSRPLRYRPLTPHSTDTAATDPAWGSPPSLPAPFATANIGNPLPAYPPQNEPAKEFWARRDRQQMARDIYVMLYTFCGGSNSLNATKTAGDTLYPVTGGYDLRRQMAQFAVNMVDALDRDNVITVFEYDRDLSNGWDLDDDITTNDGGTADRAVVFGVESQELTISEALWVRQESGTANNTQTPFDETVGDFNFLQIELRSTRAFDVPLAQSSSTAVNTGIWRLVRDDNGNGGFNSGSENAVELLTGVGGATAAPSDLLAPGSLFTIASADPSPVGSAALYIDYSGGTTDFELVAPNKGGVAPYVTGTPVTAGNLAPDLDLLHTAHSGRFALVNGSAGDFLSRTNNPGDGDTDLALQRRANPLLPQLTLAANPYVTVDQFRNVQRRELRFQGGAAMMNPPPVTSQTDALNRLTMNPTPGVGWNNPELRSQERVQPLDAGNVQLCSTAGTGFGPLAQLNSMGQTNQQIPGGGLFNLFQPHFDRDFAATTDLFHVYVVGPAALSSSVRAGRRSPFTTNPVNFGQATILQTEDQNGNGMLDGSEDLNGNSSLDINHFHRLLSLVEVPTRTHRQLGDPLKLNRVPGRINLNTIRDPRVLAALIDDRDILTPPEHTGADFDGNGTIEDGLRDATGSDPGRDWWFEFLNSRDGVDLTSSLFLPGASKINGTTGLLESVSHPFRDIGNLQQTYSASGQLQSPIEDSVLRQLPSSASRRRLFDVANEADHDGTNPPIESVLRQRLLSKIYGNSTTRSNCFVVFVTIGMFECIQTTPAGAAEPVVRIGGPLYQPAPAPPNTQVTYRAVYIIDRSEADQAFDVSGTTFDWQKLVTAKQRIN